jgi:hypothetical protein
METTQAYVAPEKKQEALQAAQELFTQLPDWLTFFKATLGIDGRVRQLFPSQEEFCAFERTDEYGQIHKMVAALRAMKKNPSLNQEPTRVITVRLPKSVHEALRAEANDHDISMNWLCIAKLIQAFDDANLPIPPTYAAHSKMSGRSAVVNRPTVPTNRVAAPSYATQSAAQPTSQTQSAPSQAGESGSSTYRPYDGGGYSNQGY